MPPSGGRRDPPPMLLMMPTHSGTSGSREQEGGKDGRTRRLGSLQLDDVRIDRAAVAPVAPEQQARPGGAEHDVRLPPVSPAALAGPAPVMPDAAHRSVVRIREQQLSVEQPLAARIADD